MRVNAGGGVVMSWTNASGAKAQLSALIEEVLGGKEVVIATAGKPVVRCAGSPENGSATGVTRLIAALESGDVVLGERDVNEREELLPPKVVPGGRQRRYVSWRAPRAYSFFQVTSNKRKEFKHDRRHQTTYQT
jgi:antitoxin (DNA-binding transcriptional repressor) of toxin-antitoxin stability system